MPKSRVAMDVEIPSDVNFIEGVVELATEKCRELRIPGQKCSLNVRVALAEAISNAILRGNGEAAGTHVRIRATVSADKLVFDIVDEGKGFDLSENRPDPTLPENLTNETARPLPHAPLMDEVEHSRTRNVIRYLRRDEGLESVLAAFREATLCDAAVWTTRDDRVADSRRWRAPDRGSTP